MLNNPFVQIALVFLASFVEVLPTYVGASLFGTADWVVFPVDVILLVVLLQLPKIRLFYKILISLITLIVCFCINEPKCYVAFFVVLCVFNMPLNTKRKKNIAYAVGSILIVYAAWIYYLNACFQLSLLELLNLSSFYWWAILAYFLLPFVQVLLSSLIFSRIELSCVLGMQKKTIFALIVLFVFLGLTNTYSNLFYTPFLETYDIYVNNAVRKSPTLNPDILKKYRIVEEREFLNYDKPTVMILVETWGVPRNISVLNEFFKPFSSFPNAILGVYQRNAERTQAAEWEDFHVVNGTRDVPNIVLDFKEKKYRTWYVHGFGGNFYKRVKYYPELGFDTLLYKEQFLEMNFKECQGGFPGICDSEIANWLDTAVLNDEKNFVYWTTLDAHAPYKRKILDNSSEGCKLFGYANESEACIHFTHEEETLKSIADLARKHPKYRFVLRGDHRPMSLYCDAEFVNSFYYGWVPVVVLNK